MVFIDEAFEGSFLVEGKKRNPIFWPCVFKNSYFNIQHVNLVRVEFSSNQQKYHMKENIS